MTSRTADTARSIGWSRAGDGHYVSIVGHVQREVDGSWWAQAPTSSWWEGPFERYRDAKRWLLKAAEMAS